MQVTQCAVFMASFFDKLCVFGITQELTYDAHCARSINHMNRGSRMYNAVQS